MEGMCLPHHHQVERYISTDILLNILIRLPASSLQTFKCVNKQWFQTISDPDFTEAHLAHQEKFRYGVIFGFPKEFLLLEETSTSSSNHNPPRPIFLPGTHGKTRIYGSCKGLVLFGRTTAFWRSATLRVANPATGDCLTLPPFHAYTGSLISASIGCCSNNRTIKVIIVVRQGNIIPTDQLVCGVLTLGSPSWRELHIPIPEEQFKPDPKPTVAGGSLHWSYATGRFVFDLGGILSLDFGQEKFRQTNVTICSPWELKYDSTLYEWDRCLAIIIPREQSDTLYNVWILREFGWAKHPDIDTAFFEDVWPSKTFSGSDGDRPYFFTTIRDGEIILFLYEDKDIEHYIAYDVHSQLMTNFTMFDLGFFLSYKVPEFIAIEAHVSSMVSCSSSNLAPSEKIGTDQNGGSTFASWFNTLSDLFTCFASTVNNGSI